MKQTIGGDFLIRRLKEAGIAYIFGVPGDFSLDFVQQIVDGKEVEWVGTCNELNAAYAADGYARLVGMGAISVTNGVGALSAINGIAGSFSEHVPVLCISGSLPLASFTKRQILHHTMGDDTPDTRPLQVYSHYTVASCQLLPHNAAIEIDRAITSAIREKRPAYIEIPSDVAYLNIEVPDSPLDFSPLNGDAERVYSLIKIIIDKYKKAKQPAFLLDIDADRHHVIDLIKTISASLSIPVACVSTVKGLFPEEDQLALGTYGGIASSTGTQEYIEKSDCLIAIGYRRIDSTCGFFTDRLPDDTIYLRSNSALQGKDHFEAVSLSQVLKGLSSANLVPKDKPTLQYSHSFSNQTPIHPLSTDYKLTQEVYWKLMQSFIKKDDVLVVEEGTSMSGSGKMKLPLGCAYVSQPVWGSIGYSLGALLGTLAAAPKRRQLLFIGDGSFQLTAQEVSTMLRHDCKPIIFLINNRGYTIERTILGATSVYNDVAPWKYSTLPHALGGKEESYFSAVVKTYNEFVNILLTMPTDRLVFIESQMEPQDSSTGAHSRRSCCCFHRLWSSWSSESKRCSIDGMIPTQVD